MIDDTIKDAVKLELGAMHCSGAHFVACHDHKGPMTRTWHSHRPPLSAVLDHFEDGTMGLTGIIPSSLGMVVVDVDDGGWQAALSVAEHLGQVPLAVSRSNGDERFHLWYRAEMPERNAQWRNAMGQGDIRGGYGYVVVWEWRPLVVASRFVRHAQPVDVRSLVAKDLPACRHHLDWNPDLNDPAVQAPWNPLGVPS